MNKITISILLFGSSVLTGCNKWLDVKPQGQTTKDEMFQNQKGFRDALTGAYIDLKNGDAYGNQMTWTTIEYMARNWDANSASLALTNLVNANYTDATVRDWLDKIYAKEYKIVADVNSILELIDGKKSIFQNDNYALIKGEALALRAFAHFDVLRLYGPMPDNPTADPILPYVQAVSTDIVSLSTYDVFAQQILADLDQAEALLKEVDPITTFSLAQLNPVASSGEQPVLNDDYYMYRQIRMNYYAVLALKARVYNWLAPRGDAFRANAAKYAQMVIDAKDNTGTPTFRLGELKDANAGDATMSSEHILALSLYNLKDAANSYFGENSQLQRSDFNVQDGYYYLNNLFPVNERATDPRWVNQWSYKTILGVVTQNVRYKKFIQKETNPILQLPLLRLSEMYLILTESATVKEDAENAYRFYCSKKGIPFTSFNATNWQTDRRNKMLREYCREFYAEGQTFFTYKRYNVTTLPASWTSVYYSSTTARYLVPKPDREINYRNK